MVDVQRGTAFLLQDFEFNKVETFVSSTPDLAIPNWVHTNTILVLLALSSQPRVGSAVTDEMSLMESCRPSVRGDFTSTSDGSQVCWFTFWCGAGLSRMSSSFGVSGAKNRMRD